MQPIANPLGDANAYRAIFFEETHEHLANVESILLQLQPGRECQDDLNAIFRAVHSIKGSAAMLGYADMAALAHLQEHLLDVLRKRERAVEAADVEAMLRAGDTVQAQALHHRGALAEVPDAALAESLLRAQIDRPRDGAAAGASGPVRRRFGVRLGPLDAPIPGDELDTMLAGLGEMGSVGNPQVDNVEGGSIAFEVELEGTATDLQSVLSLLVAPERIAIRTIDGAASAAPAPPVVSDDGDEFFVDPDVFRRRREQAAQSREATEPEPLFLHAAETASIRIATEKIDLLVNLVGELVITEAMLTRAAQREDMAGVLGRMETGLSDLTRHTRDLQEAVLAIRMLPISNVFSRFPRLVHELSQRFGKHVELKLAGETTELDRGLIERISDPLTHLVRNAIDHGLETPEARRAAGKPETGTLRMRASQRGGNIVIEVSDDGRGLDRERILARAAERGTAIAPDAPDAQVWELVFDAGFSTAREVTDVSGRGVGMDVVRRNIQAIGGTVDIVSLQGQGTTVRVSVPLTLAIMEAMTVAVAGETYVLPLAAVVESLSVDPAAMNQLPGQQETLRVRDQYLPVLRLARLFPSRRDVAATDGIAVIVEVDGSYAAFLVDELVGQQQVVVKSLEANFRKVPGISGATVMGDGSVALILDVSGIVRLAGRQDAMLLQPAATAA